MLTKAAADVEGYDAKVAASQARASESSAASAKVQETSAAKVTAANARTAESSSAASAKVVAANARSAESMRAFADVSESSAARAGVAYGSLATKALPLAAAAVAFVSGKMAADFQSNVVRLETTAGEAHKNIAMVSQGLLDMAPAVGISANELAKGMYTVESASFHGRDALLVEKAAAQGAAQEHADLAKVTDAVTTALHDYHQPASSAADVTSKLVEAVSHGKTTFDELTGSLHSVTPLASVLHVSLADVTGTLSAMTASGMSADQATQNMADTLRHLANPTNTMTAELAQLGITSSDLSDDLSTKGLAGTLQLVEEAIVNHLDPATQRVLLPALNQSKVAAQDMTAMIAAMPPELAKASQSLLDGQTSIKDYQSAAKDMGGQQGAMALQFLALMKSADGFNQVLKAGGPQAQAVAAAMAKSFGTSSALNVALMTTGENAAATNTAISDIKKAAADGKGDIKGWAEVQATAAQQAKEAAAGVGKLAIEMGDHLLPAATATLGYVNRDVIPGLEHLGSGVGSAVHWWSQLPTPVKDATLAFAAFKAVDMLGLIDKLSTGAGRIGGAFTSMATQMSAAFVAAKANQTRMVEESAALWATEGAQTKVVAANNVALWADTATQVEKTGTVMDRVRGNIAGVGAVAGAAAKGGLSALKSGFSSLVGVLGGPLGVAVIGATLGITAITSAIKAHDTEVKQATQDVQNWSKQIALGMGAIGSSNTGAGATAQAAASHLTALKNQIADVTKQLAYAEGASNGWGDSMTAQGRMAEHSSANIETLRSKLTDLRGELSKGESAWKKQVASMTPVELAQARVDQATKDLHDDTAKWGLGSRQVAGDEDALRQATGLLADEQQRANDATKTRLQLLQEQSDVEAGAINSSLAAQQAQMQLTDAIDQYKQDAADGQHSTHALTEEQNSLAQQIVSTATAAGQMAAQQAQANGVTDTTNAKNQAMLKVLQDNAQYLTGPAHDAVEAMIADLQNSTIATGDVSDATSKMGLNVVRNWDANTQEIHGATSAQIQDLKNLGLTVINLPNGNVVVTSDTGPARDQLNLLIKDYANASVNINPQGIAITTEDRNKLYGPTHAAGGLITGEGSGTSDSIQARLSNGEFVVRAAQTAKNLPLLQAINEGQGFADGGLVGGQFNMYLSEPARLSQAAMSAAEAAIQRAAQQAAAAASPYAGEVLGATSQQAVQMGARMSAARGWTGAEWPSLFSLWMRESGWNPYAVNPSSGAYGIPQSLGHGHPYNLGDSAAQIAWGLSYIAGRYGDPVAAWAHERAVGWYRDGTNYVPADQLAVLHKGEAVIPAAQNQGAPYAAPSMPGYSGPFSGATFGPTGPIQVNAQVRVFVGDREITDIVRVEATAVVDRELGGLHDDIHYATGH